MADYCRKGQLVTADQHRAMFEAVNHRMWDITGGFTQWKINACWPSVQWQIFDWYLRPMVSYYYVKRACEPLHVQLDLPDQTATVVNHRLDAAQGLSVRACVYNSDMRQLSRQEAKADVAANGFRNVFALNKVDNLTPVYFVKLELRQADGRTVSDNFYWFSSRRPADLRDLQNLPIVKLDTSHRVEPRGDKTAVHVHLRNPTTNLAFFIHLAVKRGPGGDEILPVLWDDNYFSLLPGESREVSAMFAAADAASAEPAVEVAGWNIASGRE